MATSTTSPSQRNVLVTGGAHGIGWAICQRFAELGDRVAVADLDGTRASERAATLGGGHVALAADLTDPEAAANLPARAAQALGGLQVIVNNAGMTDSSGRTMIDLPQEQFDRLIALNLTAVERLSRAAEDLLPKGGHVVNLASGAAFKPLALRGPYSATKAGIVALTWSMAGELTSRGIAINAVAPGYTRTPLVENLQAEGRVDLDVVARSIPIGRLALPEDIATAVSFCAGPGGAALSGRTLVVDGGGLTGPTPQGISPAAGRGHNGRVIVTGPLDLRDAVNIGTSPEALHDQSEIAAVVDARTLHMPGGAALWLTEARKLAHACATHPGRTRAFSLLFVTARGQSPSECAASAALGMFARTLALEWAGSGLRVNAVIWEGGAQDDLRELCNFLTGPEAGYITGQTISAGTISGRLEPYLAG